MSSHTGKLGNPLARPGLCVLAGILPLDGGEWVEAPRSTTWAESPRMPTFTEAARAATWSAPTMAILVKRASEVRLYVMDLSALPEIAGGDTLSSVTSIACTEAGPGGAVADLTLSSKAVSSGSQKLQCKIAGGTDGVRYQLTFTAATAAGYTLTGIGYLYIDDR